MGFPGGASGKDPPVSTGDIRDSVGSLGWEDSLEGRAWQLTPVLLPGESHGQMGLAGNVHRVVKSQTCLKQLSMHIMTK